MLGVGECGEGPAGLRLNWGFTCIELGTLVTSDTYYCGRSVLYASMQLADRVCMYGVIILISTLLAQACELTKNFVECTCCSLLHCIYHYGYLYPCPYSSIRLRNAKLTRPMSDYIINYI